MANFTLAHLLVSRHLTIREILNLHSEFCCLISIILFEIVAN
jgi:hypothetical protein